MNARTIAQVEWKIISWGATADEAREDARKYMRVHHPDDHVIIIGQRKLYAYLDSTGFSQWETTFSN